MRLLKPLAVIVPVFVVLFLLVFISPISSTELVVTSDPEKRQEIQVVLESLADKPHVETVREQRRKIRGYINRYTQKISLIQKELDQLSSALEGVNSPENPDSASPNGLSGLIALKQQKELELVETRLLLMTAQDAVAQLDQYINSQETIDLLFKAEPLWTLSIHFEPPVFTSQASTEKNHPTLMSLAAVILFLLVLSVLPRAGDFMNQHQRQPNMLQIVTSSITRSSRMSRIVLGSAASLALLISVAPFVFMELPLFDTAVLLVFFYLTIRLLLHSVLLRFGSIDRDSKEGPEPSRKGKWMLHAFSLISAIVVVFSSVYAPRVQLDSSVLVSSIFFFILLTALFMFCRRCCLVIKPSFWYFLRLPLIFLLTFLSILEVLGYRNLIDHITLAIGYSLVVFSMALLLYDAVDFIMQLFHQATEWFARHLSMIPAESKRKVKTHKLLGFFLKVYIVIGALILVLHQWGVTARDYDRLRDVFVQGVNMGGFTVSPARVTLALLLFVIGWPAIEYLKQFLNRGWLASAGLSKNDRETFLTIAGYLGYAAVILIALGVAGVKLTGLTVIIGALSVGIGFGLQNVVNNFISGLILMFEKPIKKGDWILVGTTEGYVKKISIRSTIVQTFDRADVIVPNSELISSQVINMMFDDQRGRLRISVGVAYGSDTDLVMRLMLEAAQSHDQVINDGSTPEPRVYFQAFGDSSLNFDLLVHLKDIDLKLRVRTDLNLMIDRAFREHGVEIPFPQRDVHIKDAGAVFKGDQP